MAATPSATRIATVAPIAMVVRPTPRIAWEDVVADVGGRSTNTGTTVSLPVGVLVSLPVGVLVSLPVGVLVSLPVGVLVSLPGGWRTSTGTTVVLPVEVPVMLSLEDPLAKICAVLDGVA